jgi:uncharacterized protein (TIGR00255 family)
MTGFGQAQGETPLRRVSVTVQTVNHRHLDVVLRVPEELRSREPELREQVARRMRRGRCEVAVVFTPVASERPAVRIDLDAVRALREAVRPLVEEGTLEPRLALGDLLRAGGLVQLAPERPPGTEELELAAKLVAVALDQAAAARAFEGERLAGALLDGLGELSACVARLTERRGEVGARLFETLRARVAELAAGVAISEDRIAQEVAVIADRADVREELDRLRAHLEQFEAVCGEEGAIGRRLDFLVQELMRELNTVGSKSRDVELTRQVVEGKTLCEQLREQVQNVE